MSPYQRHFRWWQGLWVILALVGLPAPAWPASQSATQQVQAPLAPGSSLTILTPSLVLTPAQATMESGFVQATGANGIQVSLSTNDSKGVTLSVSCLNASPQIALPDLLLRSRTAGTKMASYTPVTATNQAVWANTKKVTNQIVRVDVRVQNLWNYTAGPGATNYSDTLTFTLTDN